MARPAPSHTTVSCAILLALLGLTSCQGGDTTSAPSASFDATPTTLAVALPEAPLDGEDKADAYLCTSVELPVDTLHVTAFEALAHSEAVTSMMLYGCKVPAETGRVWSCYMRSPCGLGREAILTGWSAEAPAVALPKGVSFSVGAGTGIQHVVLQVHYEKGRPAADAPGFSMALSPRPTRNAAGMLTFASRFAVPPGKPSHLVAASCCYAGFEPLHALAFRVHTHELGRSVWMERQTASGRARVAEGDPRRGQGFSPVGQKALTLQPGDKLTTTCDFDSTSRTADTLAGPDTAQEMCNMFMMVYSETPYFMVCGNDKVHVRPEGPGGIPEGAALTAAGPHLWRPPPPQGRGQNDGSVTGQISGVAKGHGDTVWVLHRGGKPWDRATFFSGGRAEHITDPSPIRGPVVLQLKQDTGEVVRAWGDGQLVMPHGIAVDARSEAVWVTDVGRHQVIKYSMEGEELLTIGLRGKPGHDTKRFCKPTAVAVSNDGDVFIADGYCNTRIMHFSGDGSFVQQIALPRGKLQVPHSLALDTCANALYVADRGAAAVRRFNIDGDFAGELAYSWDLSTYGPVQAITAGPYGTLLALTWDAASQSAMLVHLDTTPDAAAGSGVLDSWELAGVHSPHDIALSAAPVAATLGGSRSLAVYVAEVARGRASRLHKLIVHHPSVEVVQPQHTQLADVRLPELEDDSSSGNYVRQPSDGAVVVAAAGSALAAEQTSRAAQDILAAAKTISQVSESLERVASQAAYAQAGRNSVGEATTMHLDPNLGEFTIKRPSAGQRVQKALGLQPAPQAGHSAGHYLMAFAAPLGAVAVFAVLAVALSQKVGAWPGPSTAGFTMLPMHDMYGSGGGGGGGGGAGGSPRTNAKGERLADPAEVKVIVSSQTEMASKSVRRPSALGAAELRRMAVAAAASSPSPLGLDAPHHEGLRTSSLRTISSNDYGDGSIRTRSGGEVLPPVPILPPGGRARGSIRRASASTASAMSTDTMRRLMQAGPLSRSLSGATTRSDEGPADTQQQRALAAAAEGAATSACVSSRRSIEKLAELYGRSAAMDDTSTSPTQLPSPLQPQLVSPVQRVLNTGGRPGVHRASWSGNLSAISEMIGAQSLRELAASADGSPARRGVNESGAPTARRMSPLQRKTEAQQD